MEDRPSRRRGGSLVFPVILIILGILFLLDNLNVTGDIDWSAIWRLWPIVLILFGLEIILGRRVSFGAIVLLLILIFVGSAFVWGSGMFDGGELETETFSWELGGAERAEADLELGVGELRLDGASDLGELLVAEVQLPNRVELVQNVTVDGDVARGRIATDQGFWGWPRFFGGRGGRWDLRLNDGVRWDLSVDAGVGDAQLDLSDLLVSDLSLNSGVGSVQVTMPQRGSVNATIDGGIGDLRINIPDGRQARISVDRGIGDLNLADRFERRGDFYETEDLDGAESYIELSVDIGIGSVTIR